MRFKLTTDRYLLIMNQLPKPVLQTAQRSLTLKYRILFINTLKDFL